MREFFTLVALIAITGSLLALWPQQQSGEAPPADSAPGRPVVEIKTTKGAIKIELYVDVTDVDWEDPAVLATLRPLQL